MHRVSLPTKLFICIMRSVYAKQRCKYSSGKLASPESEVDTFFSIFLYGDMIYRKTHRKISRPFKSYIRAFYLFFFQSTITTVVT